MATFTTDFGIRFKLLHRVTKYTMRWYSVEIMPLPPFTEPPSNSPAPVLNIFDSWYILAPFAYLKVNVLQILNKCLARWYKNINIWKSFKQSPSSLGSLGVNLYCMIIQKCIICMIIQKCIICMIIQKFIICMIIQKCIISMIIQKCNVTA